MIFVLGFVIAIGACLCIPQVWFKVEAFFNRSKIYNPEPVEDNYNDASNQEDLDRLFKKLDSLKENVRKLEDENSRAEHTIHELEEKLKIKPKIIQKLDLDKVQHTAFWHLIGLVNEYFYYDHKNTESQRNEEFRKKIKRAKEFTENYWTK